MFDLAQLQMIDEVCGESIEDILREHHLEKYIPVFKKHEITSDILHLLTEDDIRAMDISILGDIKRISNITGCISNSPNGAAMQRHPKSPQQSTPHIPRIPSSHFSGAPTQASAEVLKLRRNSSIQDFLVHEGLVPVHTVDVDTHGRFFDRFCKMLLSLCFLTLAMLATSLTMVCCHERVPDAEKHPPLPDLGKTYE